MATIKSQLVLNDGMSRPLASISRALSMVINDFQRMQSVADEPIDTSNLSSAENYLKRANRELDEMENNFRQNNNAAGGLSSTLRNMALSLGAAFSAKQVLDLADSMSQTEARLNLITGDLTKTKQLQDQIMQSANRSRASYLDTADAVAKMGLMAGDAFSNTDEVVRFTELVNKQFAIVGTSAEGQSAAMLQLTQAMASGVLRGEELNSIYEQAPILIQTIADYLNVPIGQIRNMAAEGQITADIVKNAMLSAGSEIDAQFNQMGYTWSQVWSLIQNVFIQTFQPILNVIGDAATFIADHIDTIIALFYGVTAAVLVFAAATWIANGGVTALATKFWTLTAAMLANPATWIAIIFGALVFIIYRLIQAVGGLTNAWNLVKQAGVIAATFLQLAWAQAANLVLTAIDSIVYGAYAAFYAVQDFVGGIYSSVMSGLQSLVNGAIGIINKFIAVLNKLPGVSIEAVSEVTFGTTAKLQHEANKQARANRLAGMSRENAAARAERQANIKDLQSQLTAETDKIQSMYKKYTTEANKGSEQDFLAGIAGGTASGIESALPGAAGNLGSVADSAGSVAAAMESSEEDLKYLRDIAEREAINRFTTAEVKIDMTGMTNEISSDMDIDGVISRLTNGFREAVSVASEGVHA